MRWDTIMAKQRQSKSINKVDRNKLSWVEISWLRFKEITWKALVELDDDY
jgi:hypothetical protein